MTGYLLRRLVTSLITLAGISMVMFLSLHIIYPNPGLDVLGVDAVAAGGTAAKVAAYNRQNGFTGSVAVQYWHYVSGLLHGNLGYSPRLNEPVAAVFAQRWARSLYLSGASLLLAILVTVPLGIFQAVRRNSLADHVATGVEVAIYATPQFLFYIVALQLFAFTVPVFGYQASQSDSVLHVMADWHDMALPIGCFAVIIAAAFSRYMRSAAVDALARDYIKVARAKGLPERLVLSRHLVRNACLPMITLVGLSVPALLAGNFLVETIFNYNGLGLTFFTGLQDADYPVLLAYTLIGAVLTVLGNLAADIALTVADPRLRLAVPRQG
jgi:peptide/nickel transport system permease protein